MGKWGPLEGGFESQSIDEPMGTCTASMRGGESISTRQLASGKKAPSVGPPSASASVADAVESAERPPHEAARATDARAKSGTEATKPRAGACTRGVCENRGPLT